MEKKEKKNLDVIFFWRWYAFMMPHCDFRSDPVDWNVHALPFSYQSLLFAGLEISLVGIITIVCCCPPPPDRVD